MAKKEEGKKRQRKKTGTKGPNKNAGRHTLWSQMDMPNKLDAVEGWARQGSTNEELWTMLGISKDLFYKWQREKPEFAEAVRRGKFESNGELINAAFKQAMGYEVIEETKESVLMPERDWYYDDEGNWIKHKLVVTKTVKKHIHPNPATLIFMLKNRLPEFYRDKIEHQHNGDVAVTFIDDIPDTPLEQNGEESDD